MPIDAYRQLFLEASDVPPGLRVREDNRGLGTLPSEDHMLASRHGDGSIILWHLDR